jgi:hypothetical protein
MASREHRHLWRLWCVLARVALRRVAWRDAEHRRPRAHIGGFVICATVEEEEPKLFAVNEKSSRQLDGE